MNPEYLQFRDQVASVLHALARDHELYAEAQMLVGSADSQAKIYQKNIVKSIDSDWIDAIEQAIPALDTVIRMPPVAIEDIEELLPLELSRHINDRSVKHLSQHTNLILDIKDNDVIPQKILNVYRDETCITYENKFINTLLLRLAAFLDKRYTALRGGSGVERNYQFHYTTEFEHDAAEKFGRNTAQIELNINLTSPVEHAESIGNVYELNEKYQNALSRIERLNMMVISYRASTFGQKMGRAYIRPPVIRTNAILKNKNMRECLRLWEFIETFDKVGYSVQNSVELEMPSDDYVTDLHSTVALQYVSFYNGVSERENRLLACKHSDETDAVFDTDIADEEIDDYLVYDSEYRKIVPVSRLMSNRKKFSEDERRISAAITVALKVDDILEEHRRSVVEKAKYRIEEAAACLVEEGNKTPFESIGEVNTLACVEAESEINDRSSEIFLPPNGVVADFVPLCPYTKEQYLSATRKKKKQIKANIGRMRAYREIQRQLRALHLGDLPPDMIAERRILLENRARHIRNEMPFTDKWQRLIHNDTD